MSVTVNNSPIQIYSCTYNLTQLIMLNPLWNDSWIQTFYYFIFYKLNVDALNKQILTLLLQGYSCQ